jgi:Ser-tRNA(Ala) deacylase AlaX
MTQLLFLSSTYQSEADAKVLDVVQADGNVMIVLDQTIFDPQGGGQPCDRGRIVSENGEAEISQVRLEPNGNVLHQGKLIRGNISVGDQVHLHIDLNMRLFNARLHSAGHLIDVVVSEAKIQGLRATKGYHFPDGAYVEFAGMIETPATLIENLQTHFDDLVNRDLAIIPELLEEEAAQLRGVTAPPGKPARFVYMEGFEALGCGCGGTHVRSTKEIGSMRIRKVSSKKGVTRISYEMAPTS